MGRWRSKGLNPGNHKTYNACMDVCPVFMDETGSLTIPISKQPVYGIGALVVHEPQRVTETLYRLHFGFASKRMKIRHELRRAIISGDISPSPKQLDSLIWNSRHHEYKFADVTHHNIQQYIDLMDAYFSLPAMEFHALLVDRSDARFNLSPWDNDPWTAYTYLAKELLMRRMKQDVFAILDLQGEPNNASVRVEDVMCSADRVKGCIRATSDMSVFLQLTDILMGCIQFDWRDHRGDYSASSVRAKAKRNLTNFVKARLEIDASEPIITEMRPYRRKTGASHFSAWLRKPGR